MSSLPPLLTTPPINEMNDTEVSKSGVGETVDVVGLSTDDDGLEEGSIQMGYNDVKKPVNVDEVDSLDKPEPAVVPPVPGVMALEMSNFQYMPRCPTITEPTEDHISPSVLVFNRLKRQLPPPSPVHYKLMM